MKRVRYLVIIVWAVFLAGCSTFVPWSRMSGTKEYRDGARDFSAMVPQDWMRFNAQKYFIITNDGIVLNNIVVERLRLKDKLEFTRKVYSADMMPQDLAEIEIDNRRSDPGIADFSLISNAPLLIDNQSGYQLTYVYTAKGGLEVKGILCGFYKDPWIYRIRYEATEQHYFEKYLPDFQKFRQTFRLL